MRSTAFPSRLPATIPTLPRRARTGHVYTVKNWLDFLAPVLYRRTNSHCLVKRLFLGKPSSFICGPRALAAYTETGATFSPPVVNYCAPALGLHPGSEPVFAIFFNVRRLKSSLHNSILIKKPCAAGANTKIALNIKDILYFVASLMSSKHDSNK